MKYIKFQIVVASVFFLLFVSPAKAGTEIESILNFHSDVEVHLDSSMTVTETIKVLSLGQKIKRGIYRDFPIRYRDRFGNNKTVGFKVLQVLRDGYPEAYHVRNYLNGKRIYIGREDIFLTRGIYVYTIVYTTHRQLGFYKDHDELYWNVTGNGWDFPIKQASCFVQLPVSVTRHINMLRGFVGSYGSREETVAITRDVLGSPIFKSLRSLEPREGLSIVVGWPKEFIAEPTFWEKMQFFMDDNKELIIILSYFFGILIYYLIVWVLFGIDPPRGSIIPLFHPPLKFSPGLTRYIDKMGYDNKIFASALINLAVKNTIKIEEVEDSLIAVRWAAKKYILTKIADCDVKNLTKDEKAIFKILFAFRDQIALENENYKDISRAIAKQKKILSLSAERIYFHTNRMYWWIGITLSCGMFYHSLQIYKNMFAANWFVFGIWFMTLMINVLFYKLMKAPTLHGRKIMDQIDGFKKFLTISEKDRLNLLNPPERTPELFERFLPYALALDVHERWAETFSQVFSRLYEQERPYHPHWYVGRSMRDFNAMHFSTHLSGSVTNAVSNSSVAPGSRSGMGGGGFSGGGGGGGGGGGW